MQQLLWRTVLVGSSVNGCYLRAALFLGCITERMCTVQCAWHGLSQASVSHARGYPGYAGSTDSATWQRQTVCGRLTVTSYQLFRLKFIWQNTASQI
jgi:hypothetical protein